MISISTNDIKAIPMLFAGGEEAEVDEIIDTSEAVLNVATGIPEPYSNSGGPLVKRSMVNAIGRASSASLFLGLVGHVYQHIADVEYKMGCVVEEMDEANGFVRKLVAIKDGAANPMFYGDEFETTGWAFADKLRFPNFRSLWNMVYSYVSTGNAEEYEDFEEGPEEGQESEEGGN